MDERWGIERALKSERELGALGERLSSNERNFAQLTRADADINLRLDRGLADVNTRLARFEGALMRFEHALEENRHRDAEAEKERKAESLKRQEALIAELKGQAEESKRMAKAMTERNRPFIAAILGAAIMLQWLIENRIWELMR